uniref:IFT140 first beta-propeller domain-containing protein n=1 Tax=Oryzias melastigma TaxID=30732 RepID=A0A3B3CB02_ORYME
MAVYFDHRIEAPESSDAPCQLTWHSTLPVLAVASKSPSSGGNVDLYLQQGEHVENCHVERPHQPMVLHWHPLKPVLALGWENGEVVLLMHPSGDQTVLPGLHTASITLLEWMGLQLESSGSSDVRPLQPAGGSSAHRGAPRKSIDVTPQRFFSNMLQRLIVIQSLLGCFTCRTL